MSDTLHAAVWRTLAGRCAAHTLRATGPQAAAGATEGVLERVSCAPEAVRFPSPRSGGLEAHPFGERRRQDKRIRLGASRN
jgi:hypothetical protein